MEGFLDGRGFVFVDDINNAFKVRAINNELWLFYWNPTKKRFSKYREINWPEVYSILLWFDIQEAPEEQEDLYYDY